MNIRSLSDKAAALVDVYFFTFDNLRSPPCAVIMCHLCLFEILDDPSID